MTQTGPSKAPTGEPAPEVSILVVSYNTRDLTLACLRSVFEQTVGTTFELLVVDNASRDGSADAVRREFPGVRLIEPAANLGFAGANNHAAALARGRYLLLLNPDTVVLDRAVDRLVAFAKRRPDAGMWGGRTLFPDGRLNPKSCWGRPTLWSMFCHAAGLASRFHRSNLFNSEVIGGWARDTEREVDALSGCWLLIERALWERVGGFDRRFYMYGEDIDLALRVRALGKRCVVTPDATIIHYGGASEKIRVDQAVRIYRARALLCRVHWSAPAAWLGERLLDLGVFTKMVGFRALARGRADRLEMAGKWAEVWKRRREWHGVTTLEPPQPPAPAPAPTPTGSPA